MAKISKSGGKSVDMVQEIKRCRSVEKNKPHRAVSRQQNCTCDRWGQVQSDYIYKRNRFDRPGV